MLSLSRPQARDRGVSRRPVAHQVEGPAPTARWPPPERPSATARAIMKVCASLEHPAPARHRRLRAEAEIGEARLGEDRERELDRRLHHQRCRHVGQHMLDRDASRALARRARRQDEIPRPSTCSAAPRVSRAKTGMLKIPMAMMALMAPGPSSAVIMIADRIAGNAKVKSASRMTRSSTKPRLAAANSAQRHADAHPDPHRHEPDREGIARADHHHRQHVASEVVRAQPVGRGRLRSARDPVDGVDRIGRRSAATAAATSKPVSTERPRQPGDESRRGVGCAPSHTALHSRGSIAA